MSLPEPGYAEREQIAVALEDCGWPSVADDVRDGLPYEVILDRLAEIGEAYSEAAEIVAYGV